MTLAYLARPAKEISVFDYTQVLFSAALGFFMFGQIPDEAERAGLYRDLRRIGRDVLL